MAVVIDGTNGVSSPDYEVDGVTGQLYPIVSGTAVTASGTAVNFTSIPLWVKRITVMFSGVSTSGSSLPQIQLGDSGGIETTGYLGSAQTLSTAALFTSGFGLSGSTAAASIFHGVALITSIGTNLWAFSFSGGFSNAAGGVTAGGAKTLSDTLTLIRFTTVNGTDTFDAGTINILYE